MDDTVKVDNVDDDGCTKIFLPIEVDMYGRIEYKCTIETDWPTLVFDDAFAGETIDDSLELETCMHDDDIVGDFLLKSKISTQLFLS